MNKSEEMFKELTAQALNGKHCLVVCKTYQFARWTIENYIRYLNALGVIPFSPKGLEIRFQIKDAGRIVFSSLNDSKDTVRYRRYDNLNMVNLTPSDLSTAQETMNYDELMIMANHVISDKTRKDWFI